MNILITGAAGYIGSKLTALLKRTDNVIAVDNLIYNQWLLVYDALKDSNFCNFDAANFTPEFLRLIKNADVIIPLAAIVGAPACDYQPWKAQRINLAAIKTLLHYIKPHQYIIFPNTNSGYGNSGDIVCTEDTPLNPVSLYGKLKDEAENVIRQQHPNHIIFRLATVFGYSYRPRLDLLINTIIWEALLTKKVILFDNNYNRNYIHIDDICQAFKFAIKNVHKMKGNVYNLGNDSLNMTKGELVDNIAKFISFKVEKIEKTDPDKRNYIVSSKKLYNTGYRPRISLADGVEELIDYYKYLKGNAIIEMMYNFKQ